VLELVDWMWEDRKGEEVTNFEKQESQSKGDHSSKNRRL
jgi:hypothetical protein